MALTILQIVPALKGGGVETGTVDLCKRLIPLGHRAIVVSSGGPMVKELEAAGAIHYQLPVHRKAPWTYPPLVDRLAEIVESHEVDVIHARSRVPAIIGYLAWRKIAGRASFRMGGRQTIPCFITTAHGHYSKHMISRVMSWGRLVIANSESIARHMIDSFGVPPQRIRLIPRGVELDRFAYTPTRQTAPKGDWRILALGRLSPIKGHPHLIRAFGIVAKQFPKARLLIAGEAEPKNQGYEQQLRSLIRDLGLEGYVEFLGHRADVPALMQQADLLAMSSVTPEAFGRVLIEAGAAGVPVVATRVGGIPEVVLDKKTGLLAPPADPVAFASALLTLLRDRALAAELAKAARHRVETVYPITRMINQTLDVYEEASRRMRILVIKISAVGDVVLATPSLRAIRQRFPQAHVTVMVGRDCAEILNRCPYVDDLIVFDRARDASPRGLLRMGRKLQVAQVDLIVDFQNNRISHWIGWFSRAPQRYGFAGRRWSWMLTHPAPVPLEAIPPVEHQFQILKLLGIEGAAQHLEMWPGSTDEAHVDQLLKEAWLSQDQPLVAIHPGARWQSKRWPAERYAELVNQLAEYAGLRAVLTGSNSERELCNQIHRLAKLKPVLAVGNTSLNELAALIKRCKLFVGSDTAPLHVAAAVGTPVITFFGPTDPKRHLPPMPPGQLKLFRLDLPCSPCYRGHCGRGASGFMECMKRIQVEEVARAALQLVKETVKA